MGMVAWASAGLLFGSFKFFGNGVDQRGEYTSPMRRPIRAELGPLQGTGGIQIPEVAAQLDKSSQNRAGRGLEMGRWDDFLSHLLSTRERCNILYSDLIELDDFPYSIL
jgi:hypothetical protein